MRVLVACEFSGTVRDAFTALGHDAWSCDILPTESWGNHYQGNIFDVVEEGWDLMIAFPPCTYLSHAGIGYFNEEKWGKKAVERKKLRDKAATFFMNLYEENFIPKIAIENPVGYMNSFFRKPDQVIEPYFFGDSQKKRTCLWLKNLPKLVHRETATMFEPATHCPRPLPESTQFRKPSKYYAGGEIKNRYFTDGKLRDAHLRSKTFPGIARAMAEQWSNL